MKKEKIWNLVGILLFYSIIVLGVILVNARIEYLNQDNSGITLTK